MKLPHAYYRDHNVVKLARDLIGKVLYTRIDGHLTAGVITETEAYNGIIDKASHAFGDRRTARTEVMYSQGGVSYVYLCYGIHYLFNIVTASADVPHAVLIRAIRPYKGIPVILERRNSTTLKTGLCVGPGKVTMALGIDKRHNKLDLCGTTVWVEDEGIRISKAKIKSGPRIGVDYAGEDAKLPYRFWVEEGEKIEGP
ncbi:MAG: DNA-3-methyladenine glycosylase [Bacteroidia bacterium]